jgi:hypothetical protein
MDGLARPVRTARMEICMLEIQLRSFPRAREIWFADEAASPSGMTTGDVRFKQAKRRPSDGLEKYTEISPFTTLLTDLTSDQDRLWSAISAATRNYINAASAKLAYEVTYFEGKSPASCYEFLARFTARKGLWTPLPSYYEKCLAHGTVACALLDGEIAVLHFYLYDREAGRAHLLWSARSLRSLTGADPAYERAVSSLNKLLHWRDLLHFKNEVGVATYDWGGIAPGAPALRGVDEFKRQFGGVPVTEWEVAWRSPLYAPLRKLARSVPRRQARPPVSIPLPNKRAA